MAENPTHDTQNLILHGVVISPGLAMGKAFIYQDVLHQDYELYDIEPHQVGEEHRRITQAVEHVRQDLHLSAARVGQEMHPELAEIFRAQAAILSDVSLMEQIVQELEQELVNAEQITRRVLRRWERKFRALDDSVLSQRADDIADLSRRLLRALQGIHAHTLETMPEQSVLVARRLLPSDTIYLSRQATVAVVVEYGGPGSHAALLTRALGIPAVGQIPDVLEHIAPGATVLVDGIDQKVMVAPDDATRLAFEQRMQQYCLQFAEMARHAHEPAYTHDGAHIEVLANVTCREDVELAINNGADGIGLYRIESFYLAEQIFPDEHELLAEMQHALTPAQQLPITLRLLDIGGDKTLPSLQLPHEENPFLGRRGIRLLIAYPDLLITQLKVMLRLSHTFNIRILIPMVTVSEDVKYVREMLETVAQEIGITPVPPLGAMIETPAAALCVPDLLPDADFFSIGTNDLTQYTMAAGRENPFVSQYFRDDHPAILTLLRMICQQAGDSPVSLCGELAGNPQALPQILAAGLRSLSVPATLVPLIKDTIRKI